MARQRSFTMRTRLTMWCAGAAAIALFTAGCAPDGPFGTATVPPASDLASTTNATDGPATGDAGDADTAPAISAANGTTTVAVTAPASNPAAVTRLIPSDAPTVTVPAAPPPPWAASIITTSAGYVSTSLGCAGGTDAGSLNSFLTGRLGPLMGEDYQHVVALGGNRYAWFFQDAFIDQTGAATRLDQARFVHNVAVLQTGKCFTLLYRGAVGAARSFEQGSGESLSQHWFWPMGAETVGNRVQMFWVQMVRDSYDPGPGDGLGWHPAGMYLATYDATTLRRISFTSAPNSGVRPLYGYAVASDTQYTYLFGNTFEQNLVREGGFFGGQHSATAMYLARVPLGKLGATPEYRTDDGWSASPGAARPFLQRFWVENPMQPRFMGGQWVSVAKVDGYWGSEMVMDVANEPWGPWTTVVHRGMAPRRGDPLMNTYHLHLLPWRSGGGGLIVVVSENARDMRNAIGHPERYRPSVFGLSWVVAPPDPVPTTTTTVPETVPETVVSTTTSTTSTTTSTTVKDTVPATTP